MFDLSSQIRIKLLGICLPDGNQIPNKHYGKQKKQIRIPCCLVQNKVNGKAKESTTDKQTMVNESLF